MNGKSQNFLRMLDASAHRTDRIAQNILFGIDNIYGLGYK